MGTSVKLSAVLVSMLVIMRVHARGEDREDHDLPSTMCLRVSLVGTQAKLGLGARTVRMHSRRCYASGW